MHSSGPPSRSFRVYCAPSGLWEEAGTPGGHGQVGGSQGTAECPRHPTTSRHSSLSVVLPFTRAGFSFVGISVLCFTTKSGRENVRTFLSPVHSCPRHLPQNGARGHSLCLPSLPDSPLQTDLSACVSPENSSLGGWVLLPLLHVGRQGRGQAQAVSAEGPGVGQTDGCLCGTGGGRPV